MHRLLIRVGFIAVGIYALAQTGATAAQTTQQQQQQAIDRYVAEASQALEELETLNEAARERKDESWERWYEVRQAQRFADAVAGLRNTMGDLQKRP